mmetsp:Transcript_27055/g.79953  ORF Transcript_27055/g.79953 Transcript_27055/m.79953 type:complete len:205 (+) Transcript_27055:410-1024(+)
MHKGDSEHQRRRDLHHHPRLHCCGGHVPGEAELVRSVQPDAYAGGKIRESRFAAAEEGQGGSREVREMLQAHLPRYARWVARPRHPRNTTVRIGSDVAEPIVPGCGDGTGGLFGEDAGSSERRGHRGGGDQPGEVGGIIVGGVQWQQNGEGSEEAGVDAPGDALGGHTRPALRREAPHYGLPPRMPQRRPRHSCGNERRQKSFS